MTPHRWLLVIVGLGCLVMAAFVDSPDPTLAFGAGIVTPGLVVLLLWSVPFDLWLMHVMGTDAERQRRAWMIEGGLWVLLAALWLPFFWRLLP